MKRTLYAKSSNSDLSYDVVFELKNNNLFIRCDCKAGEFGRLCRHIKAFLYGDISILYDERQEKKFIEVCEWIQQTKCQKYLIELDEIKKQIETLKKKEQAAQRALERRIGEGF